MRDFSSEEEVWVDMKLSSQLLNACARSCDALCEKTLVPFDSISKNRKCFLRRWSHNCKSFHFNSLRSSRYGRLQVGQDYWRKWRRGKRKLSIYPKHHGQMLPVALNSPVLGAHLANSIAPSKEPLK